MIDKASRRVTLIVLVLTALSLTACRKPFLPASISSDTVPERVLQALDRPEEVSNVVWHVSQEDWRGGMSLYAATYKLTTIDGLNYRVAYVQGVQSDPRLHGGSHTVVIQNEFFGGATGGGAGIVDDDPTRFAARITAGGYCFDSRATEVTGKTTEGREFASPVTSGFWLMVVNDARPGPTPFVPSLEQWEEITAVSSSGKVLYRLKLGKPIN